MLPSQHLAAVLAPLHPEVSTASLRYLPRLTSRTYVRLKEYKVDRFIARPGYERALATLAGVVLRVCVLRRSKQLVVSVAATQTGNEQIARSTGMERFLEVLESVYGMRLTKAEDPASGMALDNGSCGRNSQQDLQPQPHGLTPHWDEYGEVRPSGVAKMFREAGAQPGQRFCDLGSGTGKVTMIMWYLGLEATGIELNPARYALACHALARLRRLLGDSRASLSDVLSTDLAATRPTIDTLGFKNGDFLEEDLTDVDLAWSSITNNPGLHDRATRKLASLKEGSRIISAYPLKRRPSFSVVDGRRRPVFELLKKFRVSTTWARRGVSTLFLHERVGSPMEFRRY